MILVDTSVWIEVFRHRSPLDLTALVDVDDIVTCFPIVQEVLQGFDDEGAHRQASEALINWPILENPMRWELFEEAVGLYRTARRNGITVRSSIDCLIAACALRHDAEIVHRDRDYGALARVSRLKQRTL